MKGRFPYGTCAAISLCARPTEAYRLYHYLLKFKVNLKTKCRYACQYVRYYVNVVHHGKVPAFSLVWFYYTRNRLPPHWKVIIDLLAIFLFQFDSPERAALVPPQAE